MHKFKNSYYFIFVVVLTCSTYISCSLKKEQETKEQIENQQLLNLKEKLAADLDIQEQNAIILDFLILASQKAYPTIIQYLAGKEPTQETSYLDLSDSYGNTALIYAVAASQLEIVELLLQLRVNIESKNQNARNALHFAIQNEQSKIIQLLIDKGIRLNNKQTQIAIARNLVNHNVKIAKNLIQTWQNQNLNLSFLIDDYISALDCTYLPRLHASPNLKTLNYIIDILNLQQETSTAPTIQEFSTRILQTILKCPIIVPNKEQKSTLDTDLIQVISLLIDKGANVNVKYADQSSLLMKAMHRRNIEIVKIFNAQEVDIHAKNKQAKSAWNYAIEANFLEGLQYLIQSTQNQALKNQDLSSNTKTPKALTKELNNKTTSRQHFTLLLNTTEIQQYEISKYLIENLKIKSIIQETQEIQKIQEVIKQQNKNSLFLNTVHHCKWETLQYLSNISQQNSKEIDPIHNEKAIKQAILSAFSLKESKYYISDQDCIKTVEYLLKTGYSLSFINEEQKTAIMFAAESKNIPLTQFLLQKKEDISALSKIGRDALIYAAQKKDLEMMRHLISQGADVKTISQYGETAFKEIISLGEESILILLEKLGSDIHNEKGFTALMRASGSGYFNGVKYLVEKGSNIQALDLRRNTAFMFSVSFGYLKIVQYLLEQGANIEHENTTGKTSILEAIDKKHEHIVRYLIEQGANLNAIDKQGNTALILASKSGMSSIINDLIQYGNDVNAKNKNGQSPLVLSTQLRYSSIVQLLLQAKANPNIRDIENNTPLLLAAKNRDFEMIQILIAKGKSNLSPQNDLGESILSIALENNDKEMIDYLLTQDINIENFIFDLFKNYTQSQVKEEEENIPKSNSGNAALFIYMKKNFGNNILELASDKGYLSIIKQFVEKENFRINTRNKQGTTLLMRAAKNGHLDIVKYLIKKNAPVNYKGGQIKQTAAMYAARNNHLKILNYLFKRGAKINAQDEWGSTMLINAAAIGNMKTLTLLVQKKASVDQRDNNDETALMWAAMNKQTEATQYLVENKANINIQNKDGNSTLMLSSLHKNNNQVIQYLLSQKKINVNIKNKEGNTAFMIASSKGNISLLKLLLTHKKTNINIKNKLGQHALFLATRIEEFNKAEKTIQFLLQLGIEIDLQDKLGNTALMQASQEGNMQAIELLLKGNPNINLQNKKKQTALIIASSLGYIPIVQKLVQNGADTTLKDKKGLTALKIAQSKQYNFIVKYLNSL